MIMSQYEEIIQYARILKYYCSNQHCKQCPFYEDYNGNYESDCKLTSGCLPENWELSDTED